MTAIANQTQASAVNATTPQAPNASPDAGKLDEPVLDKYGRDAAERTVELLSDDAEAIDHEVQAGRHQTYDDALHYVIAHGLSEIQRTRKAAEATRQAKEIKAKRDGWKALLAMDPSLVTNPQVVAKMMQELGIAPNGASAAKAK